MRALISNHLGRAVAMLLVRVQLLEWLVDNMMEKFGQARSVQVLMQRLKQGRGKNYQLGKSAM